jgi:hypothetical protein
LGGVAPAMPGRGSLGVGVTLRGLGGLALFALGVLAAFVHVRPYSDLWYALVWLGFTLLADAVVEVRTGAALWGRELVLMLVASAALWWCFEIANALHLGSWAYSPSPDIPLWVQRLRSTVAFASLLPANVEAALLGLAFFAPAREAEPHSPRRALALSIAGAGAGLLVAAAGVPALSLPLGLSGALAAVDASNHLRARPSLLTDLLERRFGAPLSLFLANVAAGVFGEGLNAHADPHWTYDAPYAGSIRLFEMPLPGYLGYGALAWTLYALYHAVRPRSLGVRHASAPLVALGLARRGDGSGSDGAGSPRLP